MIPGIKRRELLDMWISTDWGTSSLRLYLVDADDTIVDQYEGNQGIKMVHRHFQEQDVLDQLTFFRRFLQQCIDDFMSAHDGFRDYPVVISGMASSSIGMLELPYASLPLHLDGSSVSSRFLEGTQTMNPMHLISGCQREGDVMRGEEVQMIGWNSLATHPDQITLILPGTHSKHIQVAGEQVIDFKTYMTGELYEILTHHSILKSSIVRSTGGDHNPFFRKGVAVGAQGVLSNELFRIRGFDLQQTMDGDQAASYLSGLLIGHELGSLEGQNVSILAGEKIENLYQLACTELHIPVCDTMGSHDISRLVIEGQSRFLKTL